MSDIFISYAREDVAKAEAIARALESQGWSVWWDRTIPAGRDFDDVIEEAIDDANCVVVLWSANSISSRWVKTEANEGASRNILMPVLTEDVRIPLAFRRIQAADFTTWDERADSPLFRKFVRDVAGILGAPPPAEIAAAEAKREQEQELAEREARARADSEAASARQAEARADSEAASARQAEARADAEAASARQVEELAPTPSTEPAEAPIEDRAADRRSPPPADAVAEAAPDRALERPKERAPEQPRSAAPVERSPWWLVPLLPFLTMHAWIDSDVRLSYLALPAAAWVGSRYGRRGFKVVAIGLLPFWYQSPQVAGFSTQLDPSLYLAALSICWVFSDPARWWRWLTASEVTPALPIGLFTLGGFSLFITSGPHQIGWSGSELLIAVGVFMIGLAGKVRKATIVVAGVMLVVGMLIRGWLGPEHWYTELGYGFDLVRGYSYDSLADFVLIGILLMFGRLLGDALRGASPDRPPSSARDYVLFALLWLVSNHLLYVDGPDLNLDLFGGPWLPLALAFISGFFWQRRGLVMLAVMASLTLVESLAEWGIHWNLVVPSGEPIAYGGYEIVLRTPEFGSYLTVCPAAVAFAYLGLRVSAGLGLGPGFRVARPRAEDWLARTDDRQHGVIPRAAIKPVRAWLLLPLVPLLTGSYYFTEDVGIELVYLALPAAAWLAHRYGRAGVKVFAIGALSYWIGLQFTDRSALGLSPDVYLACLLAGWAIADPQRWLPKLRGSGVSAPKHVALVALLPISAVLALTDVLQVGWTTELAYPFALLMLGWIGASARITLGLVGVLGLLAVVLGSALSEFDSYPLYLSYGLQSIGDILTASLWYLSGLLLRGHHLGVGESGSPDAGQTDVEPSDDATRRLTRAVARWSSGAKGYAGLGTLLVVAPIHIRIGGPFGSGPLWGSVWLLMLGAFIAGFCWSARGLQLAAAAVGVLCLLAIFVAPGESEGTFHLAFDEFSVSMWTPDKLFPAVAVCALLYALLGRAVAERAPRA